MSEIVYGLNNSPSIADFVLWGYGRGMMIGKYKRNGESLFDYGLEQG